MDTDQRIKGERSNCYELLLVDDPAEVVDHQVAPIALL